MGYKALVTIDITADDEQRKAFYEYLKKQRWMKVPKLTTTWKVSFVETTPRDRAIDIIVRDLKEAKGNSNARNVEYAMQLAKEDINTGSF